MSVLKTGWGSVKEEIEVEPIYGGKPVEFEKQPVILTHPNIPKPLHGLAPRVIKGQAWWDEVRQAAYASTGYCCIACGVNKQEAKGPHWLEAHEFWDISYETGVCEVKRIVPLCHYCHNFIHSGRLYMIAGKDKTREECVEILEHGFKILSDNGLKCFKGTLDVAMRFGANTFGVLPEKIKVNPAIRWKDWKLVLEGEEFHSQFEDEFEWEEYYQG